MRWKQRTVSPGPERGRGRRIHIHSKAAGRHPENG
jgi:hypothetical protein